MSDAAPDEGVPSGNVPESSSFPNGGLRPFAVVAIVALTLVSLMALVALLVVSQDDSTVTYTIPAGTGARIAAGEKVEIMPSTIELEVGDHLVIHNQDSQSYIVGPLAVRPLETVDHRFDTPGRFIGACALGSEDQLTVVVT
jgi:hypothetical protein